MASRPDSAAEGGVEVVLCTYNGEAYVKEQIESILMQTRAVDRISIFDDGSTDSTVEVIRSCIRDKASTGPTISISVNEKNLGFATNFSNALAQASGEIIFLCDQDDVWELRKVEILLELMHSSDADMVFSDGSLVDAGGEPWAGTSVLASYGLDKAAIQDFSRDATTHLVRRNCVNGAACALRRRVALGALPIPEGMPHDYWLAIWSALHGGLAATSELLYRYRQHGRNVIGIGRGRLLWQLAGIWRSSRQSREREIVYLRAILARLDSTGTPAPASFARKLAWAQACAGQRGRGMRIGAVLASWLRGDYRRFAAPHTLMRDIVSIIRYAD